MTKRTFIAINLPSDLKEKLAAVVAELKKLNSDYGIKWTSLENLHLTLHFFGDLTTEQIAQAEEGINKITERIAAFEMKTGRFGCFPNEREPKIVFIEIIDSEAIRIIIGELEVMLQNLNFPVDAKPWKAHLTLGRIKDGSRCKTDGVEFLPQIFEVKSIELMESKLASDGPVYSTIKSFPLK